MKAKDIQIGRTYLMKVSGNIVPVTVLRIEEKYSESNFIGRTTKQYVCRNNTTGRECVTRSASKFRREVQPCSNCGLDIVTTCKCRPSEIAMSRASDKRAKA